MVNPACIKNTSIAELLTDCAATAAEDMLEDMAMRACKEYQSDLLLLRWCCSNTQCCCLRENALSMLYATADAHGARAAISLGHVGGVSDATGFAHSRLCTVSVYRRAVCFAWGCQATNSMNSCAGVLREFPTNLFSDPGWISMDLACLQKKGCVCFNFCAAVRCVVVSLVTTVPAFVRRRC
jgi:hypothetical protein